MKGAGWAAYRNAARAASAGAYFGCRPLAWGPLLNLSSERQVLALPQFSIRGGVHPLAGSHGGKSATSGVPIRPFVPSVVELSMSLFLGKPSAPLVKPGDHVKLGQVIGEAGGFVSLPVHATVSGEVVSVKPKMMLTDRPEMTVTIRNDGLEEWAELTPLGKAVEDVDPKAIAPAIQAAGICGLGGAAFPTHVKLAVPEGKSCDVIIINGAECETHVTADHRLLLEEPARILNGLRLAMRAAGAKEGVVAIEDNKKDAVAVMRKAAAGLAGLRVEALKAKYPQGSEKQLIYAVTGREVPSKGLPIDVGVVVLNAGTAAAISDAVLLGRPLIERVTTVTGCVKEPANLLARIGAPVREMVEACGGYTQEPYRLIMGGCMTGLCVPSDALPIGKRTNCVVALTEKEAKAQAEGPCIRCGRCVDTCPMGLTPYKMKHLCDRGDLKAAAANDVMECVVCGCCTYSCPARRQLTSVFKNAKDAIAREARRAK